MQIGPYKLDNNLILAPMAGVTDRPFRILCRQLGAGMAVSEMVTSQRHLWQTEKTRRKLDHTGESLPRSVQIAGTEPEQMAEAAQYNIANGAQIIDINMGCPAKKVCNVAAGSALLRDEKKVTQILQAVVGAVDAPVTLKIRTGWDTRNRNAVRIAHIAQDAGIQALSVHGRTKACKYNGDAEYDTIAAIKSAVSIPVIANGDITDPVKARQVLTHTQADGLMIGRGAQGNPWIFREIRHYLQTGELLPPPSYQDISQTLQTHLQALHQFYGEQKGVRIARKHIGWYCNRHAGARIFRQQINQVESAQQQLRLVQQYFDDLKDYPNNNMMIESPDAMVTLIEGSRVA